MSLAKNRHLIKVTERSMEGADPFPLRNAMATLHTAAFMLGLPYRTHFSLYLVTDAKMAELNGRFRHKRGPTNILSFSEEASEAPRHPRRKFLGECLIAPAWVAYEARRDGKLWESHASHILLHGFLHLLGYDHEEREEAKEMEGIESDILIKMGWPHPYLSG